MLTVYTEDHLFHEPRGEFHRGRLLPPFENASRAEIIVQAVRRAGWPVVTPDEDFGDRPLLAVHSAEYLGFLRTVHEEWRRHFRELDREGDRIFHLTDAMPHVWPGRGLGQVPPDSLFGRLGYYSFDATAITAGTWRAAAAAANVALMGRKLLQAGDQEAVFALTRPPGHHAARDVFGGYCYLNNAAIAARAFRDGGAPSVAVLDVDYHHGNGTQAIFDGTPGVAFASIHADPRQAYPYFLGHASEEGRVGGVRHVYNHPLPEDTGWADYHAALDTALQQLAGHAPQFLVASLGVDTFKDDPISRFRLESEHFVEMGRAIGSTARRHGMRTLFVMEGGYANASLGANVVNVLSGYEQP